MVTDNWQVKGSFTRTYNKSSCPLPYATASMSKKKRKRQSAVEDEDVIGVDEDGDVAAADSEESDSDDIAADSMIKVTLCVHIKYTFLVVFAI